MDKVVKEIMSPETWPFAERLEREKRGEEKGCGLLTQVCSAAGVVLTGVIAWKVTPSSKSEYAKNSRFQQRCDGTFKHAH
eukprot:1850172-Rhodomonas_salina.1